jgi:hypothetical protein
MADNIDISAGTGTTVATDDCTTGHVQLTKLTYGANGDRTHVPADADGLLVNLGSNNDVTVTGSVTASIPAGVAVTSMSALVAGTANIGDVDVLTVPAPLNIVGNGAAATALRVTMANDSTGLVALTTSSAAIGKLAANSGVDIGDVDVVALTGSTIAHAAADSGNPHKIGAKVETSPKGITVAADGNRTDLYADADGQLVIKIGTTGADLISEVVTNTNGTSTAFTNFSAVASTYNYVTAIAVYNSSATPGTVDFRDGTGGAVKWTMPIPAGGGAVIANSIPLFKTSAATALAYDVSGALTTVTINVSGFQSKV